MIIYNIHIYIYIHKYIYIYIFLLLLFFYFFLGGGTDISNFVPPLKQISGSAPGLSILNQKLTNISWTYYTYALHKRVGMLCMYIPQLLFIKNYHKSRDSKLSTLKFCFFSFFAEVK